MKFVVTGGAGFIGSNLVNQLIHENNEVHIIDNSISEDKINSKAHYHSLDISDDKNLAKIQNILKNTDTIFHLAAKARVQPSIINPIEFEKNNTLGTINILKSCVDSKVKRIVYSSSSSIYGDNLNLPLKENYTPNPLSPYGSQKYYGEVLCKTFSHVYGLESISLRYFNVYGEGQESQSAYSLVIGIFMNQYSKNIPLTIRGDGEQKRDFTYVGDVVKANILASKSSKVGLGEVINIGSGENKSIKQIANCFGGDIKYIKPVFEPKETLADITLAKTLLNWEPSTSVESWIKKTIKNENN